MRIDPNTLILEFEGAELHLGSQVSILDSLNFWLSILVLVGIKLEVIRQIPIVVRDNWASAPKTIDLIEWTEFEPVYDLLPHSCLLVTAFFISLLRRILEARTLCLLGFRPAKTILILGVLMLGLPLLHLFWSFVGAEHWLIILFLHLIGANWYYLLVLDCVGGLHRFLVAELVIIYVHQVERHVKLGI